MSATVRSRAVRVRVKAGAFLCFGLLSVMRPQPPYPAHGHRRGQEDDETTTGALSRRGNGIRCRHWDGPRRPEEERGAFILAHTLREATCVQEFLLRTQVICGGRKIVEEGATRLVDKKRRAAEVFSICL